MKQIIQLILLICFIPLSVCAEVYQDVVSQIRYEYTPGSGVANVASNNDASGDLSILSSFEVNGMEYTVTQINRYAFSGCTNLHSIVIPNTVTGQLGFYAFQNCTSLSYVKLSSSIWGIGDFCFYGTTSLKSIELPASIYNISYNAFSNSGLERIEIPNGITWFGRYNFNNCTHLRTIILPENASFDTDWGGKGYCKNFEGCNSLEEVVCRSTTPPTVLEDPFIGVDLSQVILYVPKGTQNSYKLLSPWNRFNRIEEIEAFYQQEASHQTNRIYIPNLKMSRGSEATLSVFMDNTDKVTAVEFTLEMPEGFTINPVSAMLTERAKNHQMTARALKNGKYKFVVMSQSNALIDGIAGKLFTVRVKSPDNATSDGEYPLTITSAVMSAKDGRNVLHETDGGKITIMSMPNLHVTSLDCSEPVAGLPLTVKWKVRNDGNETTGDVGWKDYIWLVPNIAAGTSMTGSKLLTTVGNLSTLIPGESYENTVNVTLDEHIYGNYDLVVTSNMYGATNIDFAKAGGEVPIPYDPENADYGFLTAKGNASYVTVDEENEYNGVSDNFFYKRIYIQVPPLADIQVPKVVVVVDNDNPDLSPSPINSAGLASSSAFYSGKKIKVTATITNKGGADVNGTTINNVLYMSSTPDMSDSRVLRLTSHSMKLSMKAGESVNDEFSATIPYDWYGDTYFIVDADVNDAVYELANTENNRGISNQINILLTPCADFEPYNLNTPDRISSGMKFDVSYSVRNIGPGVPFSNTWIDKVYISSKNTGLDDSAKQIGSFNQSGSYKPTNDGYEYQGDNYKAVRSISVTDLQSGTYYIYVKIDADNTVL